MLMKNYTAVSADTVIIARKKWGKKIHRLQDYI